MSNYDFCITWAAERARTSDMRVLDFGCGAGQVVQALRSRGVNAYGCDVFYEGGDFSPSVDAGLMGSVISRMGSSGEIPFESGSFDLIVSNMVFEHVVDIRYALSEIDRVLKPGGEVLTLVPDSGVWREGHCGIPFLHWFPRHSRLRIGYAALLRSVGLGYHKGEKSAWQWSADFCSWLDDWTTYRPKNEIYAAFDERFSEMAHLESRWLSHLIGRRAPWAERLPQGFRRIFVQKLGCLVFSVRKPLSNAGA